MPRSAARLGQLWLLLGRSLALATASSTDSAATLRVAHHSGFLTLREDLATSAEAATNASEDAANATALTLGMAAGTSTLTTGEQKQYLLQEGKRLQAKAKGLQDLATATVQTVRGLAIYVGGLTAEATELARTLSGVRKDSTKVSRIEKEGTVNASFFSNRKRKLQAEVPKVLAAVDLAVNGGDADVAAANAAFMARTRNLETGVNKLLMGGEISNEMATLNYRYNTYRAGVSDVVERQWDANNATAYHDYVDNHKRILSNFSNIVGSSSEDLHKEGNPCKLALARSMTPLRASRWHGEFGLAARGCA